MNVALIHDHLVQDGGAERVAKALLEIFPDSPFFTLLHNKQKADPDFDKYKIKTSFLQSIPGASRWFEWPLPLMPSATEHYDLGKYKLLISSCSIFSKGIIPGPGATHICYCHTPPRFLWTDSHNYLKELKHGVLIKTFLPFILTRLRQWDKIAAERVDFFIANSREVQKRIKKYYNRDSEVIYPPVETNKFHLSNNQDKYFLAGGRLVGYKRFDLVINAFNRLNMPLVIFGSGPLEKKLRAIAKNNIKFVGRVDEKEKANLYSHCQAFINPQLEDFGITAVEAMASGRPVIAFKAGGAVETVVEGKSGTLFEEQTWEDLADKILRFKAPDYDPAAIRAHALQFDKEIFKQKIKQFIVEKLSA